MGGRRYDPEGTKEAILAAATRRFVQDGVGRTSLSDIAKEAGVTKSLIHHHFGSKDELWLEVKRAAFSKYFQTMLEIIQAEGEGEAALVAAIEFTFRFHAEAPEMSRLLSWMHLEGGVASSPLHDQVIREGLARIRKAQEDGVLRSDVEAEWIQIGFLVLATGWSQQRGMYEDWAPGAEDRSTSERYLKAILKIFLGGVRPPDHEA